MHKTTSATVVHIASARRAQEVFSLTNECLAKVERDGLLYQLAGKIFYRRNGQSTYGYIVDEDDTYWHVVKSNNSIEQIKKVPYNVNTRYVT